ncbi:hypothetical protein HNQ50_002034 [Silvimonas terrae]|uniref:Lipoprotein n=1 Tax=Silvimonas terrae TaxID=300266 RepID=A0A840RGF7_9NEIS|nr:hypothetical protein [Silvimonas terrae]MBB5191311.1 hypothetical protein [Silvimonas terrae]
MKTLLTMVLLAAGLTGCVVVPVGPPPRAYVRAPVIVEPAPIVVGPCCWHRY